MIKKMGYIVGFIVLGVIYYKIGFYVIHKFIFPYTQVDDFMSVAYSMITAVLLSIVFSSLSLWGIKKR